MSVNYLQFTLLLIFLIQISYGQLQLDVNANLDIEYTTAGSFSHYYYNEIHRAYTSPTLDLARTDLIFDLKIDEQWKINAHFMMEREGGKRGGIFKKWDSYKIRVPQLNVEWTAKERPLKISAGQIVNPFGNFYANQLYADRTFITTPLSYNYYTNVSKSLGFVQGLFEDQRIRIDGNAEWGNPSLYRLGYKTGIKFHYGAPGKSNITLAIVDGAINRTDQSEFPRQIGVVMRMSIQPSYFSQIGFSSSYGSFLEENVYTELLDNISSYRQLALGLDYELGFGHFEFIGEFQTFFYNVPEWTLESSVETPRLLSESVNLNHFGLHSHLKYEPPFFSGSFFAYRIEALLFGASSGVNNSDNTWDNNVFRHSLAFGYKLNEFMIFKTTISTQSIKDREYSDQMQLLRMMLSFQW